MKLLHLTDLHLPAPEQEAVHPPEGVAVVETPGSALAGLLDDCRWLTDLDVVVVTGDIADDGAAQAYRDALRSVTRFTGRAQAAQIWCVGNHDHRERFAAELGSGHRAVNGDDIGDRSGLDGPACAAVSTVNGWRMITLDTKVDGQPHGELDAVQLDWLARVLRHPAERGTVLALHHPPIAVSTMWRAANLRHPERLGAVIEGSDVRLVLAGHVHAQVSGFLAGVPVWTGPGVASRTDLTAPDAVVRTVPGAGAGVIDLSDAMAPLMYLVHARDHRPTRPASLIDGWTWTPIESEDALR